MPFCFFTVKDQESPATEQIPADQRRRGGPGTLSGIRYAPVPPHFHPPSFNNHVVSKIGDAADIVGTTGAKKPTGESNTNA
jgi:hypothetical protein